MSGRQRPVLPTPGRSSLHDISSDGRVLIAVENGRREVVAGHLGESQEKNLSWFDWSWLSDISHDGKLVLLTEQAAAVRGRNTLYVRPVDGSPATPWVATSPQATLTVQLAKRSNVSSVTVERGGTATSFAYTVQTSTDGSTWQTVASAPNTSTGTDAFAFKPRQAQYVRLNFPGASKANVPDIDEVTVG